MDAEILGPLRVRREGRELTLGGTKERTVLGVLLLEHGRVVDVDRLVGEVWPNQPPAQPVASLRVLISRIRRNLEAVGLGDRLRTVPPGYLFATEPNEVDADRFAVSAREGSDLIDAGHPAEAAVVWAEALSLWRGDVLSGLELGTASQAAVQQLSDLRRVVAERRAAAERHTDRGPGHPPPEAMAPPVSSPLPRPIVEVQANFVGRRMELARGLAIFDEVVAGTSQTILISGEPGVGKTSLVAELVGQMHGRGAVVLYGWCDEELNIAYQPFRLALQEYLAGLNRAAVEDLFLRWPRLARLAGAWTDPASRDGSSTDAEGERALLFEAVDAWLDELTTRSPVVLVIDDLHWAGGPTASLLRHVSHQVRRPLLCVATFRDTDAGEASALRDMLAGVHRRPNLHRMSLTGLDREGVVALVEARAGRVLEAGDLRLAAQIHDETGGNPFFVTQLVRHVFEAGPDGAGAMGAGEPFQLPDGVRDVIRRRIDRLPPTAQQVLRVAAVIGPIVPFPLLSSVWPRSNKQENGTSG